MIRICNGVTKKGDPCKNRAKHEVDGRVYCGIHYKPSGTVSTDSMSRFDKRLRQLFGTDMQCESTVTIEDHSNVYKAGRSVYLHGDRMTVKVDSNTITLEGDHILHFNRDIILQNKCIVDIDIGGEGKENREENKTVCTIKYRGIVTVIRSSGKTLDYDEWKKGDKVDTGEDVSGRLYRKYVLKPSDSDSEESDSSIEDIESTQQKTDTGPIDDILSIVRSGKSIFITGEAGTGKSYNMTLLADMLDNCEKTSSTGVSSYNIGGRTIHSFAGLGIMNIRDFLEKLGKSKKTTDDKLEDDNIKYKTNDEEDDIVTANDKMYNRYLKYKALCDMLGLIYSMKSMKKLSRIEDIKMYILILYKYIEFMYPSSRYADRVKALYDIYKGTKTICIKTSEDANNQIDAMELIRSVTDIAASMSDSIGMKYLRIETNDIVQIGYHYDILTRILNKMAEYRRYNPAYRINEVQYLIIDEVSMLSNYDMEMLDWQMRTMRNRLDAFMGGIVCIFVGDLLQLGPVCNKDSTPDVVIDKDKTIKIDGVKIRDIGEWTFGDILQRKSRRHSCSYVTKYTEWMRNVTVYTLTKNYRQSTDTVFRNILKDVRVGQVTDQCKKELNSRIVTEVEDSATVLYGKKQDCDERNEYCIDRLDTELYRYEAEYAIKYTRNTLLGDEQYICQEYTLGITDKDKKLRQDRRRVLSLKVGAKVMLLSNLSIQHGLVNGAIGTVTALKDNRVTVQFDSIEIDVPKRVEKVYDHMDRDRDSDRYIKTEIYMKQYPLSLAYGITIHKSQGNTYDSIVISMTTDDIWNNDYGKAYVALSRCRTLDGLRILSKGIPFSRFVADEEIVKLYKYWRSKTV